MNDRARRGLFPFSVWPPMVDALTLVLAAFVLVTLVALLTQRAALEELRARERELVKLRDDKARIERRLAALGSLGSLEIEEGKVILQGEVLFDSGSDALLPAGRAFLERLAGPLAGVLEAETDQMVMIGGHTDDRPIHRTFRSNWELSTARAVAVMHVLTAAGVDPARFVAAGFGQFHPRSSNDTDDGRRRNRRIELLLVPMHSVSSR
jgi:chemotaxis protein MotB